MNTKQTRPNYANIFLGVSAAILVASLVYAFGGQSLQGSLSTPVKMESLDKSMNAINQYPMGVPTRAYNGNDCANCVNTYSACHAKGTQALRTGQKLIVGEGRTTRAISARDFLTSCLNTFKACKNAFQCR